MTDPAHAAPSRPEPVLEFAQRASYVVAVIGVFATGFAAYGFVTDQKWALGIAAALTAVTTGLAKVLPTQAALAARAQVTPNSSPQAVDGAPLVAAEKVSGADLSGSLSMGPDL